ncbi:MAG: hypothetical protein ACLP2Y_05045 [Limisphaerales bacterium]
MLQVAGESDRMFHSKPNKEPERFYLLPGMGGREARRKQLRFLKWAALAALGMSAILAAVMYLLNRFVF